MPQGIHRFYALNRKGEDYYLGGYEGDPFNDQVFKLKLQRVCDKVAHRYGFGFFSVWWSPSVEKPFCPLSNDQKYKRAITKAYNIHRKHISAILDRNSLFVNDFLKEETERHCKRIDELKKRYEQCS